MVNSLNKIIYNSWGIINMDKIDWLRDVIYLLPIAGIIWKGALMSAKIKENAKEIEECKNVIQKQNDAIKLYAFWSSSFIFSAPNGV